jgi:hypothetical protein
VLYKGVKRPCIYHLSVVSSKCRNLCWELSVKSPGFGILWNAKDPRAAGQYQCLHVLGSMGSNVLNSLVSQFFRVINCLRFQTETPLKTIIEP